MNVSHVSSALVALLLSACTVNPSTGSGPSQNPPSTSTGVVSVLSSIEGATQSSECDMVGGTDLELAVFEGSSHYTTVTAPCTDFQISVTLPEGDFNADVTLLDSQSRAVSTTLTLNDLRVVSGTNLKVYVDFPSSSILP